MATLNVNPPSLDFGDVTTGQTVTLTLILTNLDSNSVISIDTITCDNASFSPGSTGPIPPNGQTSIIVVFTAGTPGIANGLLSINSDADNNPTQLFVTGNSIAAGARALSISPSSFIFNTTKEDTNSATQTFTVTNTGTATVTVQIPVVTAPFVGVGLPGAPTVLTAAASMSFGIRFSPIIAGYVKNATGLVITSDAISNPDNIDLEGQCVLITPAYVVSGGTESSYAAFGNIVKVFDVNDLNCESPAFAERTFALSGPGYEARTMRVEVQYEDVGETVLNVSVTNERDQSTDQDILIGTPEATNKLRNALADLTVSGELAVIRFTPNGPLSMIAYIPRFEPGGEVKK